MERVGGGGGKRHVGGLGGAVAVAALFVPWERSSHQTKQNELRRAHKSRTNEVDINEKGDQCSKEAGLGEGST